MALRIAIASFTSMLGGASNPHPSPELAGYWGDVASGTFLEVAPGRIRLFELDRLTIRRATYSADSVTIRRASGNERWSLMAVDGLLTVEADWDTYTLRRLKNRPPQLEAKPLALPPPAPIRHEDRDMVLSELVEREERRARSKNSDASLASLLGHHQVDRANTEWLEGVVVEFGWIDSDRFGNDAARIACRFVQRHSELPLRLAAIPAMEPDAKRHRLEAHTFAACVDRTRYLLVEPQVYGTQCYDLLADPIVICAIEDREHVDARRAEIGLPPLSESMVELGTDRHGNLSRVIVEEDAP